LANNKISPVLAVILLIVLFLKANWATKCGFLFLYGLPIFGLVAIVYGFPGWGGKITLLLVVPMYLYLNIIKDIDPAYTAGLKYLSHIIIIFSIFYLLGPQNDFCREKYLSTIRNIVLFYFALIVIIDSISLNYDNLGQLLIGASLFVFIFGCQYIFGSVQNIIYELGYVRTLWQELFKAQADINFNYQFLGPITTMGIVMYLQNTDNIKTLINKIPLILCGTGIILISGARQNIIMFVVGLITLYYCNIREKSNESRTNLSFRILIISAIFAIIFYIINVYNFVEVSVFKQTFEANTFTEAVSRNDFFESAIELFIQNPLLGTGLGGFYLIGSGLPPGITYPHNIFLELLCEFGILGTLALLFPILIYWRNGKLSLKLKSAKSGLFLLPFFVILLARYSISAGLADSCILLSFIAAYISVKHQNQQELSAPESVMSTHTENHRFDVDIRLLHKD